MNDQAVHSLSLEFHRARLGGMRAAIEDLIRNRPASLLASTPSLVNTHIRARIDRGIKAVPIYKIAAQAPRYQDFNRAISSTAHFWDDSIEDAQSPIKLYQLGALYFVRDGNRRVAEARARGQMFLLAQVTEYLPDAPLDDAAEAITQLLRDEYHEFLVATELTQIRPGAQLECTALGSYAELLAQIEAHRVDLSGALKTYVTNDRAVISWYDTLYVPITQAIRQSGLLERFRGHTETDIYLWMVDRSTRSAYPPTQNLPTVNAILRMIEETS